MRALRIDAGQDLRLTDTSPQPVCQPGEALVRVTRVLLTPLDAAVAGLSAVTATPNPFSGSLGHLVVGVVKKIDIPAEAGAALQSRKALAGKRVVVSPSIPCAHCEMCRAGLSAHCRSRSVLGVSGRDGGLAEYVAVPALAVTRIPDGVSDEKALLAHPLACALHAANMLKAENKAFVTVLGDSLEALLTAQVLSRVNKSVRLLSSKPELARLCERWGLRHRPTTEAGRRQDQDAVIDCSGGRRGLRLALQLVRPRGTVLLMSPMGLLPYPPGRLLPEPRGADSGGTGGPEQAGPHPAMELNMAVANEVQVLGCREGPLPDALAMLSENAIDVSPFLSSRCRLEHAGAALQALRDPDHLPFVVEMDAQKAA